LERSGICAECRHAAPVGFRRKLLKKYGLLPREYQAMKDSQNNRCRICSQEKKLAVDHDHNPPFKVRGLLCISCNAVLGLMKDSPALLRAAASYLEERTTLS
jgi:hypothetical protein